MKVFKITIRTLIIAVVLAMLVQSVCLASFSGSLATDFFSGNTTTADGSLSGIAGTNLWINNSTPSVFSWVVTQNGNVWNYQYTLDVPQKAISHLIIEASDSFTDNDISNIIAINGGFDGPFIQLWTPGGSNIGMPGNVFGIKFDDVSSGGDVLLLTISFDSPRNPVWGDFYAVDGKKPGEENAIWNTGFADADPLLVAPHNGTENHHILVPDTTIIPAPGAILLAGFGTGLVGWLRKRKKL